MSGLLDLPKVARCEWCGESVPLAYLGNNNLPPNQINCPKVSGTAASGGTFDGPHALVWWMGCPNAEEPARD